MSRKLGCHLALGSGAQSSHLLSEPRRGAWLDQLSSGHQTWSRLPPQFPRGLGTAGGGAWTWSARWSPLHGATSPCDVPIAWWDRSLSHAPRAQASGTPCGSDQHHPGWVCGEARLPVHQHLLGLPLRAWAVRGPHSDGWGICASPILSPSVHLSAFRGRVLSVGLRSAQAGAGAPLAWR